jgi:hypothetical protein
LVLLVVWWDLGRHPQQMSAYVLLGQEVEKHPLEGSAFHTDLGVEPRDADDHLHLSNQWVALQHNFSIRVAQDKVILEEAKVRAQDQGHLQGWPRHWGHGH